MKLLAVCNIMVLLSSSYGFDLYTKKVKAVLDWTPVYPKKKETGITHGDLHLVGQFTVLLIRRITMNFEIIFKIFH